MFDNSILYPQTEGKYDIVGCDLTWFENAQ